MSALQLPAEDRGAHGSRTPVDHASSAADHVFALIVVADPTYRITPEAHDRMVDLLLSVVALLAGGAR